MKIALFTGMALAAASALVSVPAAGQPGPASAERVSHVVIYGRDPCPRASGDDIVICVRKPESERYRIPEALRAPSANPENESWSTRAESVEYVGRTGTQSCSTVGPGGFTGCWEEMMRNAREERRRPAR
jgi:hypothetical protein